MSEPPLRAAIIPVTPLQQNCTLLWCTETMLGAFVDPGGDLPRLKAAAAQAGVTIEKILLTHGHIDHCGAAGIFAEELGVPIEGPHEEDLFWIARLEEDGQRYGITGRPFEPDSLAGRRRHGDGRQADLRRPPLPRPHARPCRLPPSRIEARDRRRRAVPGIGRPDWDFPRGNHQQLLDSITQRLWPMGDDTAFVPGHGPMSTFGHERRDQPVRRRSGAAARLKRLRLALIPL